jgi:hypothetical protein
LENDQSGNTASAFIRRSLDQANKYLIRNTISASKATDTSQEPGTELENPLPWGFGGNNGAMAPANLNQQTEEAFSDQSIKRY